MKFFNGILETPDEAIAQIDEIGGPHSHSNYPWGWAQAGNTPFKWYKQNTHEGGVHVPLVVHWPNGIADRGGLRDQFHHVNDIVPTIYDVARRRAAGRRTAGSTQMPVTGTSMRYTFDDAGRAEPQDGAVLRDGRPPRHLRRRLEGGHPPHRAARRTTTTCGSCTTSPRTSRSATTSRPTMPEKLAELIALWWREAEEHGVLPLDDRLIELFGARFQDRTAHPANRRYTYRPPMSPLPAQAGGGARAGAAGT